MRTWLGTVLLWAACGTPPAIGGDDDDAPPDGPGPANGMSQLERCVLGGGSLKELWSVGNQHGPVTTIIAGSIIVLGSADGSVKQWTVDGDSPDYGTPFTTSGDSVAALALSGDGHIMAATRTGAIADWRLSDAGASGTNMIADSEPSALNVVAYLERVLVGTTTGQLISIDRVSRAQTQLTSTLWGVHAIEYVVDRLYTAGHFYGTPQIDRRATSDPNTVIESWRAEQPAGHIRAVALDAAATKLAIAGDRFVAVLAPDAVAAGPTALVETDQMATGATMLPGAALFATAGSDGTLKLWKTDTAEQVATLAIPPAIGIARDAAGTRLYTSGPDGRLHAFGCH